MVGAGWDHPRPSDLQAHLPSPITGVSIAEPANQEFWSEKFFSFFVLKANVVSYLISTWALLGLNIMSDLDSHLPACLVQFSPCR